MRATYIWVEPPQVITIRRRRNHDSNIKDNVATTKMTVATTVTMATRTITKMTVAATTTTK